MVWTTGNVKKKMGIANVSLVTENKIFITNIEEAQREHLKSVGILPDDLDSTRWVIQYFSEVEKVALFTQLRDLGIPFSIGSHSGWGPSEQFEDLRNRGLLNGNYKQVAWRRPQEPVVIER
ncbi:MAG: hypothetical protein HZB51_02970 [Chloroflexi bacterium]|nr:hypothetical protein [Chloroflexota bacterium]